jgi:hypothetical protein
VTLDIVAYQSGLADTWDEFCAGAINATFLHTRKFLSYHGDRFEDASLMLFDAGKLVGVLAAARSGDDRATIVSHPGITYGGIVHDGRLAGSRMIDAIADVRPYYAGQGCTKLVYKVVPYIYGHAPAQDDLYSLFRHGAIRSRCDLSCTIDLAHRRPASERRRRGLKKAARVVTLSADLGDLNALWPVLQENLARKHGAQPVHSLDELKALIRLFPESIVVRCAAIEGKVVAGVVFFNSHNVWHAQYIASSEAGYDASALDAVFNAAIQEAADAGDRYFDFGTSNERGGTLLNDGLYRFKQEFGGGGVAYEFYELNLP